jgi:spermidine synthase
VSCIAIPLCNELVGDTEWLIDLESWPLRIALHVGLVFLLPSTILGLIGPVVAKLALDQGRATGKTVGNVYAWGALGSIAGTFTTGFYLIPLLTTSGVVVGVSATLALVGVTLLPFFAWPFGAALALGAALLVTESAPWRDKYQWGMRHGFPIVEEKLPDGVVYLDESQYSFIKITEEDDLTRDFILDNLIHSHFDPNDPLALIYEYEQVYAAVTRRVVEEGRPIRTLFLGGGGYIFPRYVKATWPGSHVEVAEIDPAVTQAAVAELGLESGDVDVVRRKARESPADADPVASTEPPGREGAAIRVHHLDARNRVDDLLRARDRGEAVAAFDLVYGDAFNDFSVPFHLVTLEFTQKIRELLRPEDGVYMLNVIDIYASGRFVGAVYSTLKQVFPWTYVFVTDREGPEDRPGWRETFVVVGALRDLSLGDFGERDEESEIDASVLEEEHIALLVDRSGGKVLTDDHSPVENLLDAVVRRRDLEED